MRKPIRKVHHYFEITSTENYWNGYNMGWNRSYDDFQKWLPSKEEMQGMACKMSRDEFINALVERLGVK